MKLRIATPDDLAQVNALVQVAYSPWIDVIGATPGPMLDDYSRAIAQGHVQVLEDGNEIEALMILVAMPDALLIDNIAVHPSAQGRGLAKRLLRAAEFAAQAERYKTLRLYTHEKMLRNIGFYHRNGFEITKRVAERGLNRVYMERRVTYPAP